VAGEHPTGTDGDVPGSRNRRVVGAVALVALAVGIAVLLTPFGGEPSDDAAVATTVDTGVAVRFEAADVAGDDPFTPSVTNDVVPTVRAIARETAAATVAELPTAGAAGPPVAAGDTPGLYGGDPETPLLCDALELAERLAAEPDAGSAAAEVLAVDPDELATYLDGTTPVLLTIDTVVTNHALVAGRAEPFVSVLEAGTVVLVDERGAPVVRCACGNPLAPVGDSELPSLDLTGPAAWPTFDPDTLVHVRAGGALSTLSLIDVATGDRYERPLGASPEVDGSLVAVAGTPWSPWTGAPSPQGSSGSIRTFVDGDGWQTQLTTEASMLGIAASDELLVAVGAVDELAGGVAYTSRDGHLWSDVTTFPDPLGDVAFDGDGTWVAVGADASADLPRGGGSIYLSSDGIDWEQVARTEPDEGNAGHHLVSIAHDGEGWLAAGEECSEPGRCASVLFRSSDGRDWEAVDTDSRVHAPRVVATTDEWVLFGRERLDAQPDDLSEWGPLVVGTSADAEEWTFRSGEPDFTLVDDVAPGATADRWWGVGLWEWSGDGNMQGRVAVLTSGDLTTWETVWIDEADGAANRLQGIVVIATDRGAEGAEPPSPGNVIGHPTEDGRDDEPRHADGTREPAADPPPAPEPEPEPGPETEPDADDEFARCVAEVTANPDDPAWAFYTESGLDPEGVCTVLMAS
jgi:hypothetical protein